MTDRELVNIITKLEDDKLFIEYQLQNYRERLDRLRENNRESEEINPRSTYCETTSFDQ